MKKIQLKKLIVEKSEKKKYAEKIIQRKWKKDSGRNKLEMVEKND